MSEKNVKIKIQEVDYTTPQGATVDSTDVVFIPGFMRKTTSKDLADAEYGVPRLCTSVYEFEKAFGDTPHKFGADYGRLRIKKGDPDRSYIYAKELLAAGLTVVYVAFSPDKTPEEVFYKKDKSLLLDVLKEIEDKSLYSVKYITSGGYPSVTDTSFTGEKPTTTSGTTSGTTSTIDATLANKLIETAKNRGDAVALIDYDCNEYIKAFDLDDAKSFYRIMNTQFGLSVGDSQSYAAAWYPWGTYRTSVFEGDVLLPPSYAYLRCLAASIKNNPNWLAVAGVNRGVVPGLVKLETPNNVLSTYAAEQMQPAEGESNQKISVNCITEIRPYGRTIWGNRTLLPVDEDGIKATNMLNIRNMLNDLKKLLYRTGQELMFEQNNDTLWLKFKGKISPFLDQLKLGNGISDYALVKETRSKDGSLLPKNKLTAIVRVYPVYAVEYFDLTVEVRDDDVTVSD